MHRASRRGMFLACGSAAAAIAGCLDRPALADLPDGTTRVPDTPVGTPTRTATPTSTTSPAESGTPRGVAWRREVGGSVTTTGAGRDAVFVGTKTGDVVALGGDGAERWTVPLDGPLQQVEPADGLVFAVVGESALFASHRVVALGVGDGEERWRFAAESRLSTPVPMGDRPVAGNEEGVVYGFE